MHLNSPSSFKSNPIRSWMCSPRHRLSNCCAQDRRAGGWRLLGLAADGLSVMAPGKVLQQEVTYLDSICRGRYGYSVEEGRKCLPGLQTEVTVVIEEEVHLSDCTAGQKEKPCLCAWVTLVPNSCPLKILVCLKQTLQNHGSPKPLHCLELLKGHGEEVLRGDFCRCNQ